MNFCLLLNFSPVIFSVFFSCFCWLKSTSKLEAPPRIWLSLDFWTLKFDLEQKYKCNLVVHAGWCQADTCSHLQVFFHQLQQVNIHSCYPHQRKKVSVTFEKGTKKRLFPVLVGVTGDGSFDTLYFWVLLYFWKLNLNNKLKKGSFKAGIHHIHFPEWVWKRNLNVNGRDAAKNLQNH